MFYPYRKSQLRKKRQNFNLSVIKYFRGMVNWWPRKQWSVLFKKGGNGKTSWRGSLNSPWKWSRVSPGQLCGHLGTESAVTVMPRYSRHPGGMREPQKSMWLHHRVWEAEKAVMRQVLWTTAWNFHCLRQLERWSVWTRLSFGEDHCLWHEGGRRKKKEQAKKPCPEPFIRGPHLVFSSGQDKSFCK